MEVVDGRKIVGSEALSHFLARSGLMVVGSTIYVIVLTLFVHFLNVDIC